MTSNMRLRLCAAMIAFSAIYGVIVASSPQVASAISLGYIAGILTVFVLVNAWKRP